MLYIIFFLGFVLLLIGLQGMLNPAEQGAGETVDFYQRLETTLSQVEEDKTAVREESDIQNYIGEEASEVQNYIGEEASEVQNYIGEEDSEAEGFLKGKEFRSEKVDPEGEQQKTELRRRVYELSDQGNNGEDIARQLNLGKGEVELILGLRR